MGSPYFEKKKNSPPPGFKRVNDWSGMTVVTTRELQNGWGKIPVGTVATVGNNACYGIHLTSEPCKCCGLVVSISKVSSDDIRPYGEL